MYAEAHLITPAYGTSGDLYVTLTTCHDNDLSNPKHVPVPSGGLKGQKLPAQTSPVPNGCGYASASFVGSYQPINLFVHTNPINASGSPQWEQWRG